MIVRVSFPLVCLLLPTCIMNTGCSSSKPPGGTITGKVYLGEELLSFGEITFMDPEGNKSACPVRNGNYRLGPIAPGNWKIGVVSRSQSYPGQKPEGAPPFSGPNRSTPPAQRTIPARYQDPEQSGLACAVRKGEQEHNVRLPLKEQGTD